MAIALDLICNDKLNIILGDLHHPHAPWEWNIFLHEWLKFVVNVGNYSIHGAFGSYLEILLVSGVTVSILLIPHFQLGSSRIY